ncbi:hypothetical protein H0H81_001921 [Sphagnurus paluster]|uniref:Uncharacterized protein n=1 Tax=Sphagnurus paluster TaxID=117069 RepID=A0A9P7FT18_9AGAR|nr:hypothetical protein H0H81_001921 [Sphagnurus paluster]
MSAEPLSIDDRLTFPPFPTVPPGVTIIPFKDFKERGIQMFAADAGDDVERDGLGIPTVELRVKHNTDSCKTETKRKRRVAKAKQARAAAAASGVRREWWEVWADTEDSKMSGPYNPQVQAIDRLYEAATDFRKSRTWPPGGTGISSCWDQFRLFVGLLANTPVWTRKDKEEEADQGSDSDIDGDDEAAFEDKPAPPPVSGKRPRARPPYALYGTEPVPVTSDEEVRALLANEANRREEQVVEFLNDPEHKMRVFLSSYIRQQGLIWTDKNLVTIPRLLDFFVRFLLRNRVFPEPEFERPFTRSLDVIALAQKELILTSKIAKQLPDDFARACKSLWGQRAEGYKPLAGIVLDVQPDDKPEEDGERDAKRAKLDAEDEARVKDEDIDDVKIAVDQFEEELKASNVEVLKVDDILKDAKKLEAIRDNLNPDIDTVPAWAKDESWGPSATGEAADWGSSTNTAWGDDSVWGPTADTTNSADEPDFWAPAPIDWTPPPPVTHFRWLGPTALPLTHTPGAVEVSMRRIKAFSAPPAPGTAPKSPLAPNGPDADAVDAELEHQFATIVLAPWLDWDRAQGEMPHLATPRILDTSRGPIRGVIGPEGRVEPEENGNGEAVVEDGKLKPHDPLNDDITLLVEPEAVPLLSVGLGLAGTWVQIAREQDFVDDAGKKKKKKAKKPPLSYLNNMV